MKIKIYASVEKEFPTPGPYKTIDIVERESPYQVGDMTHYGEVILLLPSVLWLNDGVEQGVVVKLVSLTKRDGVEMQVSRIVIASPAVHPRVGLSAIPSFGLPNPTF